MDNPETHVFSISKIVESLEYSEDSFVDVINLLFAKLK